MTRFRVVLWFDDASDTLTTRDVRVIIEDGLEASNVTDLCKVDDVRKVQ